MEKAWILKDINELVYENVNKPVPGAGEALIKVMACGICGSDVPRVFENGAHNMPLIPGHEFAGVVDSAGKNVDISWIGKRVGIFPLIPCGKCRFCMAGRYELCSHYDYIGSRRDGAFAEYVVVPEKNLIQIPDDISFEEAAMLEPMAVAVHAMRIGIDKDHGNYIFNTNHDFSSRLSKDACVAVCGFGTIGVLLTMFLMEAGYNNISVIGNKDFQRELAQKIGLPEDNFIDSRSADAMGMLIKRGGADLFFDCVGKSECLVMGINSSAPLGRIVTVGNPYGDVALSRDTYWKILRKQLTILGTWNSSFSLGENKVTEDPLANMAEADDAVDDWKYVITHINSLPIRPSELITHKLSLEELNIGLELMRDKKEPYCKVMVTMEE